ncbi:MAG: MoaD/ThiS family protein [Candidatus Methanomethylophilaceae archaeon]|nr:MoaD/ThiS family protein [Candidatus Methanomethylophilaceae archaeon]
MGMIQISGQEHQVAEGKTVQQAVSDLGFHPDSYLYLVDGRPVPMDTVIADSMTVRAMRVASGG